MTSIKIINIQLPDLSDTNKQDNKDLFALLGQLENVKCTGDQILETPIKEDLFPKIKFTRELISSPRISFITQSGDIDKSWNVGNLNFGFNLSKNEKGSILRNNAGKLLKDNVGDYVEIEENSKKFYALTIGQLLQRFDGKLKELNHAGMNFGPKILEKKEYLEFRKLIAQRSNLYNYPTGEEWPFIIPSNENEFRTNITDKSINRNPKFELVYSKYHPNPLIQIDIETNLTEAEVLKLLPEPYGVSFDNLKDMFRTVFIHVNWNNVFIRFDLRFKSNGEDFGYWIIKEGGRIGF